MYNNVGNIQIEALEKLLNFELWGWFMLIIILPGACVPSFIEDLRLGDAT